MDGLIGGLTVFMLMLPAAFLLGLIFYSNTLVAPFVFLVVIYSWIWLWFRPGRFVVSDDTLTIVWPVRTREIIRSEITAAALMTRSELRNKVGWGIRVGAGGVWGGFGWLYTQKRGFMRMYISRVDRYVWFETEGQPWIITPERPEEFLRALRD